MYSIENATPPKKTTRSDDIDFNETIAVLVPGQSFDFPLNSTLKNPFEPAKRATKIHGAKGARYRWVTDEGGGVGTVYRVK